MAKSVMTTKSSAGKQTSSSVSGNGRSKTKRQTGTQQKVLEDLLEDGLLDIYDAEKQLIDAIPKMAGAADNEDLQDAFNKHLEQTKKQAERLEKIFSKLNINKSEAETCEAMQGLIKENDKVIREYEQGAVKDSALIIGAQKVEHYEIAVYGSLCELCDVLGYHQIGQILGRTLDEEENTDNELSNIAMEVNDDAYEESRSRETETEFDYQKN